MKNQRSNSQSRWIACLLSALFLTWSPCAGAATLTEEEARDIPIKSMADEIDRSMKSLQIPGKPKPYYLRYEMYDFRKWSVTYEYGAKTNESDETLRGASADLRVGDYEYDSSVHPDATKRRGMYRSLPVDDDYTSMRRQLWLLTDTAYKYATEQLDQGQSFKRGHDVRHVCEAFSKETPQKNVMPLATDVKPSAEWLARAKSLSQIFEKYPRIRSSFVTLGVKNNTRRVVSSEGTISRYSRATIEIGIVAYARTPDGVDTWDCDYIAADDEKGLPAFKDIENRINRLAENLTAECSADRLDYYYGPVLFESAAASELVQHGIAPLLCSVPGDNLQPSRTLLRSLNERILPEIISISDEPGLKEFAGKTLAPHPEIDSDGLPAEKVTMVDHGFLRKLLSGRTPVYPGQHSNGHNILDEVTPTTLVVTAHTTLGAQELRKKLLDLARARGLKEAIIVKRVAPSDGLIVNGSPTETRSDSITGNRLVEICAVDVATGKERRIRGLQISEFGRQNMDNVVAAGDDANANSTPNWRGHIRSVIAPSLLIENMELEEDAGDSLSPYPVSKPN